MNKNTMFFLIYYIRFYIKLKYKIGSFELQNLLFCGSKQ
ncbi:hypothetical protein HMPREF9296_0938 [Prevotella disiens FB035-09AN]|uniref:Uncharacterized protein n=1 Tax=Prevotella disiens FB035-09AN TaxID=866771 RepID=E1KQ74_9BACT|nr:hypothetical protein HMPREF9296_0938 [Prevotella disiens FB035-09AN]